MEGFLSHKIGDKEIHFFIGVYSLEKSLEEMDASLSDLGELLNKKFMPLVRLYMFYSAEYQALKNGESFPYTAFDVHSWIDETGGTDGEFYLKFTKTLLQSLGISPKETDEPEKKSIKKNPKK